MAVFHAVGLQFEGSLSIACPTDRQFGGGSDIRCTSQDIWRAWWDEPREHRRWIVHIRQCQPFLLYATYRRPDDNRVLHAAPLYASSSSSPLTLSAYSTLSIYGTTIGAYNVSVASSWYLNVLRTLSLIKISHGSA